MKYVNQLKYPNMLYVTRTEMDEKNKEWGRTSTIKSSGCGLCAAIMVADRLLPEYQFDLDDALALAYESGANRKRGTSYACFGPAFAEKMGLKMEATKDVEALRNCLRTGGAAVILVDGDRDGKVGLFTHSGHFMAIINEETDGRFAILDPSLSATKYEEEGRKGRVEIRNGVIVLADGKTLEEETANRATPFYLFWRA